MADTPTIDNGRVVSIDYTLADDSGTVIDTSEGSEPLSYLHGHGQIIPGLEKKLEGATIGDALSVKVPPDEGYGEHDPSRVFTVPRERFDFDVKAGDFVQAKQPDGTAIPLQVTGVTEQEVTVDANHPLAGQTLNFSVKVVGVREATAEELEHGHSHDGHAHD